MLKEIKLNTKDWMKGRKKSFLGEMSQKKLTMCKKCYTFNYKNSWHFYKPPYLETNRENEVFVRFTICPACLEEEANFYKEMDPIQTWA